MRVPLRWLNEFVQIDDLAPTDLAHLITMAGLEVGRIEYIGVPGGELVWDAEKIRLVNILEVKPHPDADKLVLADVDYGGDTPHTVVTGAPNLFPYRNQGRLPHPLKGVFAREGARLYDGHKEGRVLTTLKGRPVRGIMSDAMLCSEKELGISDEHEGIIILDADAPIGVPAADLLGDVVLHIDLTPNLARCLSIVGVAREVAALTGRTLRLPAPQVPMDGAPVHDLTRATVATPELCPRFTLGVIEGITVKPSPYWMQYRLRLAGMRPINNIVDISNYVMLEWGQPTHAFDADCVQDQHLIVRLPQPGERVTTLDDRERDLAPFPAATPGPLIIADERGPLSLAGVMGGASSEVSVTTRRVILEAATWEPVQIRRTARHFKLPSEASHRFERGVDIDLPPIAQRRTLQFMRDLAGGTVANGIIDLYPQPYEPPVLHLTPAEVARIVGVQLPAAEIARMLTALGFAVDLPPASGLGDGMLAPALDHTPLTVHIPSFRRDVTYLADLCEDVARVYGYEQIAPTRLSDTLPPPDQHPDLVLENAARDLLVGAGLSEIITYALTSMESVAAVQPSAAHPADYLKLANASTPEREYLRRSLLVTVLEALATNLNERERVLLFEIGRVYLPRVPADPATASSEDWLPDEPRRLAIGLAGQRIAPTWDAPADTPLDFFDLKGVIELLLTRYGLHDRVQFVPLTDDERLHPGRAAQVLLVRADGKTTTPAGIFGEVHPDVSERLALKAPRALVAELELDVLIAAARPATYHVISRYPAISIDLAFAAPHDVPEATIAALIRRGAGNLLESLTLFDIYTGEQIAADQRSLAYRLTFRAPDRTLNDDAVGKVRAKIVRLLEREAGVTLRG